jgi:hypothetical protein
MGKNANCGLWPQQGLTDGKAQKPAIGHGYPQAHHCGLGPCHAQRPAGAGRADHHHRKGTCPIDQQKPQIESFGRGGGGKGQKDQGRQGNADHNLARRGHMGAIQIATAHSPKADCNYSENGQQCLQKNHTAAPLC